MDFKKIKSFVLLMCIILTSSIYGQDRLEPYNTSIYNYSNSTINYHTTFLKVLFEDIHPDYYPLARYIVTPAFHSEYVLTFDDYDLPKYHLTLTKPDRKISVALKEENPKIETIKIKKEIDSSDMKLIVSLIDKSISKSRLSNHSGYDGTNYFFTNLEKTATIWSPNSDSKTYKLIEIMNEIIKLVKSEEKTIKFSPELVKRIKKLKPD